MQAKTFIHQFDPEIYPRKLWVTTARSIDILTEQLEIENKQELAQYLKDSEALVFRTRHLKSGLLGFCIVFSSKSVMTPDTITHESVHFAEMVLDDIKSTQGGEPMAYLAGWCAQCINQVRTNKYKYES